MLITIFTILLIAASWKTVTAPLAVYGILYLIVSFVAAGVIMTIQAQLDLLTNIYVIVCASGMGVLLLWVVMTLTLKTSGRDARKNKFTLMTRFLYSFIIVSFPFFFLLNQFNYIGQDFDLIYLKEAGNLQNYTYREFYGTNIMELGYFLYIEDPVIIFFGGLILFFALIAAVFLTMEKVQISFLYKTLDVSNLKSVFYPFLLGGGMVDTLDLGSSAFAWGFKSLPSNFEDIKFFILTFLYYGLTVLLILVGVLITVAFYTLGERKVMAGIQRRKGPNVVGFHGVLQPIVDGLKLVLKENIIPVKADRKLFIVAPLISFIAAFSLWAFVPFSSVSVVSDVSVSILCIFALSSLGIYGVILGGWASNSKYAFLGALRTTAQMISYEIILGTIYLSISLLVGSLNLFDVIAAQKNIWFIIPLWPFVIIFIIAMLAETNRAPFDLPEAEAEIVAGYNVEYSGIAFAFFFLAEYSNMLVFSALFTLLFLGGGAPFTTFFFELSFFIVKVLLVAISFVIVRAGLPRLRYDQLMLKSWNILLPITFALFVIVLLLQFSTVEWLSFFFLFIFLFLPVFAAFFSRFSDKKTKQNNIGLFLTDVYNYSGVRYKYSFVNYFLTWLIRHVSFFPLATPFHWYCFVFLSGKGRDWRNRRETVTVSNQQSEVQVVPIPELVQPPRVSGATNDDLKATVGLWKNISYTELARLITPQDRSALTGYLQEFLEVPSGFANYGRGRQFLLSWTQRYKTYNVTPLVTNEAERKYYEMQDYKYLWDLLHNKRLARYKEEILVYNEFADVLAFIQNRQIVRCLLLLDQRFTLAQAFLNRNGDLNGCYESPALMENWELYKCMVRNIEMHQRWMTQLYERNSFERQVSQMRNFDLGVIINAQTNVNWSRADILDDPAFLEQRKFGSEMVAILGQLSPENVRDMMKVYPVLDPQTPEQYNTFEDSLFEMRQIIDEERTRIQQQFVKEPFSYRIEKHFFQNSYTWLHTDLNYFRYLIQWRPEMPGVFFDPFYPVMPIGALADHYVLKRRSNMPYQYGNLDEVMPAWTTNLGSWLRGIDIGMQPEENTPTLHEMLAIQVAELTTLQLMQLGFPRRQLEVVQPLQIAQANTIESVTQIRNLQELPIIYGGKGPRLVTEVHGQALKQIVNNAEFVTTATNNATGGWGFDPTTWWIIGAVTACLFLGTAIKKYYYSELNSSTNVIQTKNTETLTTPPAVPPSTSVVQPSSKKFVHNNGVLEQKFIDWKSQSQTQYHTYTEILDYRHKDEYLYSYLQQVCRFIDNIWFYKLYILAFSLFIIALYSILYYSPLNVILRKKWLVWQINKQTETIQQKSSKKINNFAESWGEPRFNFKIFPKIVESIDGLAKQFVLSLAMSAKYLRYISYHYKYISRLEFFGIFFSLIFLAYIILTQTGSISTFSTEYCEFPYDISEDLHWGTIHAVSGRVEDLNNHRWHAWFFDKYDPTWMYFPDTDIMFQNFSDIFVPDYVSTHWAVIEEEDFEAYGWACYYEMMDSMYDYLEPSVVNNFSVREEWPYYYDYEEWPSWLSNEYYDADPIDYTPFEHFWNRLPGEYTHTPTYVKWLDKYFDTYLVHGSWQYWIMGPILFFFNAIIIWWNFFLQLPEHVEDLDNPNSLLTGPDRIFLNDTQKQAIELDERSLYNQYMDTAINIWRLKNMPEDSEATFNEILAASQASWIRARKEAAEIHWKPYTTIIKSKTKESTNSTELGLALLKKQRDTDKLKYREAVETQWTPYRINLQKIKERNGVIVFGAAWLWSICSFYRKFQAPKKTEYGFLVNDYLDHLDTPDGPKKEESYEEIK